MFAAQYVMLLGNIAPTFILAAYYTSWSIYQKGFEVQQIPATKLSHVNYAFAKLEADGRIVLGDRWADVERPQALSSELLDALGYQGNLAGLNQLKREHRHLKVGLSVGGWLGSENFSAVSAGAETRQRFAQSAAQLILRYNFDYLDIDWEYPVAGGFGPHSVDDARNFVLLLQAVKMEFERIGCSSEDGSDVEGGNEMAGEGATEGAAEDATEGAVRKRPELTAALSCGWYEGRYSDIALLGELLDWAGVMCYDFAGGWSAHADHHSALYTARPQQHSVDAGIQSLLALGFPASKIVLGVPIYGREYEGCAGLARPFARPDTYDKVVPYAAIVEEVLGASDRRSAQLEARSRASVWRPSARLTVYDSVTVVREKAQYVQRHGLRGMMFWELSGDCHKHERHSLIHQASAVLPVARGAENVVSWEIAPRPRAVCRALHNAVWNREAAPVDVVAASQAKPIGPQVPISSSKEPQQ